ncbi:hypothetical protein ACJIZ3_023403 [Penstemon smallii]|uniref:Protein FAR1-RELATED SEQUENCE n=1 Tax=Penstemon smallii TaxID=265156 RepID=A0ABD3TPX4_9LAMI
MLQLYILQKFLNYFKKRYANLMTVTSRFVVNMILKVNLKCCKKFEFIGILRSHALKVLNFKQIVRIPDQYIKKRWMKTAKKKKKKKKKSESSC